MLQRVSYVLKEALFKNKISVYSIENKSHIHLSTFFEDAFRLFTIKSRTLVEERGAMKTSFCLVVTLKKEKMSKESETEFETEYKDFYFRTKNVLIDHGTIIEEDFCEEIIDFFICSIDNLQDQGSGWSLHKILRMDIYHHKYDCFNGSQYIPLPPFIANKKAVINVKNNDDKCFMWAVLAALHPIDIHAERVSKYVQFLNELNFDDLNFPIEMKDIAKFEKQNETISVNVYGVEDAEKCKDNNRTEKLIVPLRITKDVKEKHIHLLLLQNEISSEQSASTIETLIKQNIVKRHYCYIKNLGKLVKEQNTKNNHKIFLCDLCLNYFASEFKLNEHLKQCSDINKCKIQMPTKAQKYISFKNFNRKLEVPFIIYADIESILKPVSEIETEITPKGAYQKHIPNSIGFYFHCRYDNSLSFYKSYAGEDCMKWFINMLHDVVINKIAPKLRFTEPMILSTEEEINFITAKKCHICSSIFLPDEKKVRDHCHITGVYRGAAHNSCNLKFQVSKNVPVVFHNLSYDSHFLIETLSSLFEGKINIIPLNSENYISFTKVIEEPGETNWREHLKLKFIDSFRFMSYSLQKLASYLPPEKMMITRHEWSHLDSDKLKLLLKKGVYPYDFVDSFEKLKQRFLPPIDAFYNQLTDSNISTEEYEHAKKVWNEFKIENLLQYTELYLKTDVLLLADVFENFRDKCLQIYGLDPAHYYTTAGYSWEAMLKFTDVNIELITNVEKLLFIERGKINK